MPDASGYGYWVVTQTGDVYTFGDAPYFGAPGNVGSPVTSAVRTPDGRGYWILVANGTVYAYGDAHNYGSPSGQFGGLDPASAVFSTSDGGGYWVAAAIAPSTRMEMPQRRIDGRHEAERSDHRRHRLVVPAVVGGIFPPLDSRFPVDAATARPRRSD